MNAPLYDAARALYTHWFPTGGATHHDLKDHLKEADLNMQPAEVGVALALEAVIEAQGPLCHSPLANAEVRATVYSLLVMSQSLRAEQRRVAEVIADLCNLPADSAAFDHALTFTPAEALMALMGKLPAGRRLIEEAAA